VLDEKDDEKILDIISQSDLVSYFSKNSEKLPEIASKSLDELKLVHPLISVRGDARLGDALGILYENRVSGVAIVEHATEHLLGNLSASDLRGFYNEYELAELNQPILEFLSKRRTKPTLFCTGKTTLKEAIARLTENRVHRLYIIDGESTKRAIGVVTLSDVLYALLPVEKDPYSTKHERDEAAAKGNKTSHSASSSSKKTKKELF
jgi:CBS domain-containing protein